MILLPGFNCLAQRYPEKDFKAIHIPMNGDPRWMQKDTITNNIFDVAIVKNHIEVHKASQSAGKLLTTRDGRFLAIDLGEFGGDLLYQPNDKTKRYFSVNGKQDTLRNYSGIANLSYKTDPIRDLLRNKQVRVSSGNINAVFKYKDTVFFMQVVDRTLNRSTYGIMWKVSQENDTFIVSKVMEFNDPPTAVGVYRDTIFVATHGRFYAIKNWKKELIINGLSWQGLWPHSITVFNNNVYIGMRGAYAKIDLEKKDLLVYKYVKP